MDFRTWGLPVYGNLKVFTLSTLAKRLIPIVVVNGRQIAQREIASDALSPEEGWCEQKIPVEESISFEISPRPEYNVLIWNFCNPDRATSGRPVTGCHRKSHPDGWLFCFWGSMADSEGGDFSNH